LKDASQRFQTMGEVAAALQQAMAKPADQQPSIAVLPFANMIRDSDDERVDAVDQLTRFADIADPSRRAFERRRFLLRIPGARTRSRIQSGVPSTPATAQNQENTIVRMMLKVSIPVEAGNTAVKDGSLRKVVGESLERLKPEAAYFLAEAGCRTAILVFDLAHQSEIPSIAEPFFLAFNAAVTLAPVMNADDLKIGLEKLP
jgi:hypothetical protein